MIDPLSFKTKEQEMRDQQQKRSLRIQFLEYQKIETAYFPKTVQLNTQDELEKTIIFLNFKKVKFNEKLSFPYTVPENYQRINIAN